MSIITKKMENIRLVAPYIFGDLSIFDCFSNLRRSSILRLQLDKDAPFSLNSGGQLFASDDEPLIRSNTFFVTQKPAIPATVAKDTEIDSTTKAREKFLILSVVFLNELKVFE